MMVENTYKDDKGISTGTNVRETYATHYLLSLFIVSYIVFILFFSTLCTYI